MTQDVFSEWHKLSCGPLAGKLEISIRKQVAQWRQHQDYEPHRSTPTVFAPVECQCRCFELSRQLTSNWKSKSWLILIKWNIILSLSIRSAADDAISISGFEINISWNTCLKLIWGHFYMAECNLFCTLYSRMMRWDCLGNCGLCWAHWPLHGRLIEE